MKDIDIELKVQEIFDWIPGESCLMKCSLVNDKTGIFQNLNKCDVSKIRVKVQNMYGDQEHFDVHYSTLLLKAMPPADLPLKLMDSDPWKDMDWMSMIELFKAHRITNGIITSH
jgi:hypothetical protein